MAARGKPRTRLNIRTLRPTLPGPWHYLDLPPMLTAARNLTRDLPPFAYPILAFVVWRTMLKERNDRARAILNAQRTAIRRSQTLYVVKPRRKRFLLF